MVRTLLLVLLLAASVACSGDSTGITPATPQCVDRNRCVTMHVSGTIEGTAWDSTIVGATEYFVHSMPPGSRDTSLNSVQIVFSPVPDTSGLGGALYQWGDSVLRAGTYPASIAGPLYMNLFQARRWGVGSRQGDVSIIDVRGDTVAGAFDVSGWYSVKGLPDDSTDVISLKGTFTAVRAR